MTTKLYAFTCGTVTGEFAHLMEGGEGDITVPVPVFLIEHPKGRALFDTGLHPDCQSDPAGRLGSRLAGLFRIGFQPGEEGSARLEAIDRDPDEIDLIINSHFHFDHVGGNALIPNATMLVQRREWDAGMNPDIPGSIQSNRDRAELVALRRLGTVEDCAKVVEFLATDLSDFFRSKCGRVLQPGTYPLNGTIAVCVY